MADGRRQNLSDFFSRSSFVFSDLDILDEALTHSSWTAENGGASYERLEFLGDALLEHYVSWRLFHRFPDRDEGFLTRARSAMVRTTTLAAVSRRLGFAPLIRCGAGQKGITEGMLADVFESVLAALFLQGGELAIDPLLQSLYAMEDVFIENETTDAKSRVNELAASLGRSVDYRVERVGGPDHLPLYRAEVWWDGKNYSGLGQGKKEAEQKAAAALLADR